MEEATIRAWYDIFKDNHELVEIRMIDPTNGNRSYSGYFTDIEQILKSISKFEHCNIYFTLNIIDPACYSREQHDKISTRPKSTTSDNEILARKWCLIDVDVDKPSDTNSTDAEKELAKGVVNNIYKFLRDEGFETPIVCDSANGFHLLLKQAMKSTPENTQIMKEFLQVLDMYFSTDKVKVDCSTFNPSRICKLYGVYSRKGANTKERPQRVSKILRVPKEVKATPNEYFQKVASYLPKPERKDRSNNWGANRFDLDDFIARHDIKIRNVVESRDFTKYVLESCPFNSSHKAPDSAIFKMRDGGLGFKCLHNSDSHYTFHDFRLLYEPDAYDTRNDNRQQYKQRYYQSMQHPFIPAEESEEKGKKWLSLKDVKNIDITQLMSIPTGIKELDKKIIGLFAGELSVLSGLNASGKTSLLDCLALNIVQKGFKVAIWSGEMQGWRFKGWINQMAAGKSFVKKKEGYDNLYYTPNNVSDKISEWLDGKLFLYNNDYGSDWQQLFNDIKELVDKEGTQLIILDNLAALSIESYDGEKYSKQTKFIIDIKEYAKQKNIHIILVCHPRKQNDFLRKESISGTADLTNIADNVFLIHRVGKDFEVRAGEFFGEEKIRDYLQFNNVIEVSKNRQFGITDYLVGLYYEIESRRFKNSVAEHIIYGWQDEPTQQMISYPNNNSIDGEIDDMANELFSDGNDAPF